MLTLAGGQEIALPRKAYALAAYLLVDLPGGRLHRSDAAAFLWDEIDVERRAGNLRQLLSRLRILQDKHRCPLFQIDGEFLSIDPDGLSSDVEIFRNSLGANTPQSIVDICDAYSGPLLERNEDGGAKFIQWLRQRRTRFQSEFVATLLAMVESRDAASVPDIVVLASERLLRINPGLEPACRALMRAHAGNGEIEIVRQIYTRLERHLRLDGGATPGAATRELFELLIAEGAANQAPLPEPVAADAIEPIASPRFLPRLLVVLPVGSVASSDEIADLGDELMLGLWRSRTVTVLAPPAVSPERRSGMSPPGEIDYVLELRARRSSTSTVSVRLSSTGTREMIWADAYELGGNAPWPAAQVTQTVLEQIDAHEAELVGQATARVVARRQAVQGQRMMLSLDLPTIQRARNLLKGALATDSESIPVLAALARSYSLEGLVTATADQRLLDEAEALSRRIQRIDPDDFRGYHELAVASLYSRRFDVAQELISVARQRNPADRDVWIDLADIQFAVGQSKEALATLAEARLQMPHGKDIDRWIAASACYDLEDYRGAIVEIESMSNPFPAYRLSAASYAMLGEKEIAERLRVATLEYIPGFRVKAWLAAVPIAREAARDHYEDGLLIAGFQ